MYRLDYTILFLDIGGVLLSNGWGKSSRIKAAIQFGLDFDEMDDRHNLVFSLFESGKISLDEYLESVVFNHPRNFSAETFKKFMLTQSLELPGFLSWLREWKKDSGLKVISIHNEGKELDDYRIAKFGLTDCFDAFIPSYAIRMCKPDPELYKFALAVAHRPARACLYFDDTLVHVEAAKKLGIEAFHHESFEQTKKILEEVGPFNQATSGKVAQAY